MEDDLERPHQCLVALIVLPQEYNADERGERRPVETEKFDETMEEIAKRFGGGALWRFKNEPPRGYWWNRGVLLQDELAVIEVDIPDDSAAKQWLRNYVHDVLVHRFNQEAIYIKIVGPVEVIIVQA